MRLYLDANAIIYAIEGSPDLRGATLAWMRGALKDNNGEVVTSRLSLLEVRSKPIHDADTKLLELYDNFFRRATIIEVSAAVIDRATELRARFALRSADAIHVASAMLAEADTFLTGDRKLTRVPDLKVVAVAQA